MGWKNVLRAGASKGPLGKLTLGIGKRVIKSTVKSTAKKVGKVAVPTLAGVGGVTLAKKKKKRTTIVTDRG